MAAWDVHAEAGLPRLRVLETGRQFLGRASSNRRQDGRNHKLAGCGHISTGQRAVKRPYLPVSSSVPSLPQVAARRALYSERSAPTLSTAAPVSHMSPSPVAGSSHQPRASQRRSSGSRSSPYYAHSELRAVLQQQQDDNTLRAASNIIYPPLSPNVASWEAVPQRLPRHVHGTIPELAPVPAMPEPGAPWAVGEHWNGLLMRRPPRALVAVPSPVRQGPQPPRVGGPPRFSSQTDAAQLLPRAAAPSLDVGQPACTLYPHEVIAALHPSVTTTPSALPKQHFGCSAALHKWAERLLDEQDRNHQAYRRVPPPDSPAAAAAALLASLSAAAEPSDSDAASPPSSAPSITTVNTSNSELEVYAESWSTKEILEDGYAIETVRGHLQLLHHKEAQRLAEAGTALSAAQPTTLATSARSAEEKTEPEQLEFQERSNSPRLGYVAQQEASVERRALAAFACVSSQGEVGGDKLVRAIRRMGRSKPNEAWIGDAVDQVCEGRFSLDQEDFLAMAAAYEERHWGHLREEFDEVSRGMSGSIGPSELAGLLRAQGITALPGLVPDLMEEARRPGVSSRSSSSDGIDFDQFAYLIKVIFERLGFPRAELERLRGIYKRFAKGESGLGIAELALAFRLDKCFASSEVDREILSRLKKAEKHAVEGADGLDEHSFLAVMRERRERGIDRINQVICELDPELSGELAVSDLPDLLEGLGMNSSCDPAVLLETREEVGLQHKEELTFDEVYKVLDHYRDCHGLLRAERDEIKAMILRFDKDESGGIDGGELGAFIRWLGYPSSYELEQLFYEEFDLDSSWQLEIEELVLLVAKYREAEIEAVQSAFDEADQDDVGVVALSSLRLTLAWLIRADISINTDILRCEAANFIVRVLELVDSSLQPQEEFDLQAFHKHIFEAADALDNIDGVVSIAELRAMLIGNSADGSYIRFTGWLQRDEDAWQFRLDEDGHYADSVQVSQLDDAIEAFALCRSASKGSPAKGQADPQFGVWEIMKLVAKHRSGAAAEMQRNEGFCDADVKELRSRFQRHDARKTGRIGRGKLAQLLEELCSRNTGVLRKQQDIRQRAQELLAHGDEDGDGTIDFEDFLRMMRVLKDREQSERMRKEAAVANKYGLNREEVRDFRQIFSIVDADGSGDVTLQELVAAVSKLVKIVNAEAVQELERMIDNADQDGSRTLDFAEFMEVICQLQARDWRGLRTQAAAVAQPSATFSRGG